MPRFIRIDLISLPIRCAESLDEMCCLSFFYHGNLLTIFFSVKKHQLGNYAGISLVAFSALMSNTEGDTQIWEHSWQFYVGVAAPLFGGLLVSNVLSSLLTLEKPERV